MPSSPARPHRVVQDADAALAQFEADFLRLISAPWPSEETEG